MHGPAPFRWTSIYDDWRGYWLLGGDREPGPDFLDLPVESPNDGWAVGGPALDWWPTKQIAERQRMLRQQGTAALILWREYWHTRKGTLHTADLLATAKDAEEAAAIWLAASLWDFLHPVDEEWRGQPARLTREVYRGVVGFLRERDIAQWHHRMTYALPETILDSELAEMVRPRGPRHVVTLACLNVRLVRAEWSLVRVVGSTQRLRSVE
jgi:hypothetical protein